MALLRHSAWSKKMHDQERSLHLSLQMAADNRTILGPRILRNCAFPTLKVVCPQVTSLLIYSRYLGTCFGAVSAAVSCLLTGSSSRRERATVGDQVEEAGTYVCTHILLRQANFESTRKSQEES